ncbi:hypothetical protein [Flavobacterium aquidurense]|uniref:Uncharacterized protein n=1 Tax=Flavobacterium aquidurense TaxID=362413 RepID=A0A0Q0RVI1_9FLAO|nr:hypothetical protein [Flavobacterium aquidurense]KQB41125.1 hypothetical protein RC62_4500 [Flavobacterium aquidurense]
MNDNIFGCFMKIGFDSNKNEQDFINLDKVFTPYIWGDRGISNNLKKLKHEDYGKDLILGLFQFNVEPTAFELEKLKEIESYRKKEKSIGMPIIINDENFFSKSESERYAFLKESILQKMDLLSEVVKKKKLDTNIELLKSDLKNILITI